MSKKKNEILQDMFVLRIPMFVFIIGIIIWFYLVISNYYSVNNINIFILEQYFSLEEFGEEVGLGNILSFIKNLISPFFAMLIFFAAYSIGKKIFLWLKFPKISLLEKIIFSVSLGFLFLIIASYIFGIAGLFYKNILVGVVIVLSFLGVYDLFITGEKREFIESGKIKFYGIEKLWILLILFLSFIILIGCLSPEIFYDSLVYHLAKPNFWLNSGKIVPDKTKVITGFYPGNGNIIYALGLSFLNETVCKSIHFIFGIFAALTTYAMGRKFFNHRVGLFAAVLFFTVPYFGILSYRSGMEMFLSFFETITIFSFLLWIKEKNDKWLLLSAINCGLGVGTKYTTLYCLLSVLIIIFLYFLLEKKGIKQIVKHSIKYIFITFLVASPWLVYNFYHTGNPVYPYFAKHIGFIKPRVVDSDPAIRIYNLSEWKNDFINILKSPWTVSMGQHEEAFLGITILLCIPLFLFFKSKWEPTKYLFIYILIYWIIWSFLHKLYFRYFFPVLPIISFLSAVYIFETKFDAGIKKIILLVFTVIITGNIFFVTNMQKYVNNCLAVVLNLDTRENYLNTIRPTYPTPYYGVADWINKNLPKESLISMMGELRNYYIERKIIMYDLSNWVPLVIWSGESKDEKDLYQRLKNEGVTHIFLNPNEAKRVGDIIHWEGEDLIIFSKFWNKYVKEIYRDIPDISFPQQKIYSMKKQVPDWWKNYSSEPHNYNYVYEIMSEEEANKPHQIPYNFFLEKNFYSETRWQKLQPLVQQFFSK